jgi:hypothetical protein
MMRKFFNPTNLCWLDNLNNVYQVIYLYNNTTPRFWLTQYKLELLLNGLCYEKFS